MYFYSSFTSDAQSTTYISKANRESQSLWLFRAGPEGKASVPCQFGPWWSRDHCAVATHVT